MPGQGDGGCGAVVRRDGAGLCRAGRPDAESSGGCFDDADETVQLWETHLAEELPGIYTREPAAVVFVSAGYAGRDWTRLERRAAFSQAVIEAGVYVLPARFDDSELPGLLPEGGVIDLRG